MKRLLLTVISFLFLANVLLAQTTEDQLIDEIVSQVDTEELRLIVEQLSGETSLHDGSFIFTRQVGTEGKEKAAEYIAEQYSNIGNFRVKRERFNPVGITSIARSAFSLMNLMQVPILDPEVVEDTLFIYDYALTLGKKYRWKRWENIFAILKGDTTERVLTLAHFDSNVRRDLDDPLLEDNFQPIREDSLAPGADDNATGVAATIVAARILSQYRFKNSICFLNPDAEELFYIGTTAYILKHLMSIGKIKTVINVDMIGYDHDNDGLMRILYNENDTENPFIDNILNDYDRFSFDIEPIFLSMEYILSQGFGKSDYFFFYVLGIKRIASFHGGLYVTETEYDEDERNIAYHTEEDTTDNINFDYMTEIVKLYIASLAREAGIIGRR